MRRSHHNNHPHPHKGKKRTNFKGHYQRHSRPYHHRPQRDEDINESSQSELVTESAGFFSEVPRLATDFNPTEESILSDLPHPPTILGLSVLIPVYNEILTIKEVIERIERCGVTLPIEIVVTDDCSTDGTSEILEKMALEGRIQYLRHEKNQGKGAALRACIRRISYDYAIIQDADLEYDSKDYERMLQPLLNGNADVVYGSRFIGGTERRILTFWHSMANSLLTLFSNMLTDMHLTDMETCYKCFKSELLRELYLCSDRFGIEPELTAKIKKMAAVVYEVPISYHGRNFIQGKKIGWRDGVAAFYHMVYFHFSPKISREAGFDRQYAIMRDHRMNRYIYQRIAPFLGHHILEVGSGLGGLAQFLINRKRLILSDKNQSYVRYLQRKFRGIPNIEITQLDVEENSLALYEGLDTILMLNVLEHIREDERILEEAYHLLPVGGRLILMVPLQRGLMSPLDEALGRLGRYETWEIQDMLKRTGFQVESFQQMGRLGTLLWWIAGILLRKKHFSQLSMKLYSWCTPLVRFWDRFFPCPRGLQGIVVGIKIQ